MWAKQIELIMTIVLSCSAETNKNVVHVVNFLFIKVEGVLCDGPSLENMASTVVDCTKIETGQIGFYRVGLIPKSKVKQARPNFAHLSIKAFDHLICGF